LFLDLGRRDIPRFARNEDAKPFFSNPLVLRTCLNAERALVTRVAAPAVLCVNYTAGADHLVFSMHLRALQRPIRDDALDLGCALQVVLSYIVVR
jgi:hypothetical protein